MIKKMEYAFRPIDPEQSYDRGIWIPQFNMISKLERRIVELDDPRKQADAIRKLGLYLHKDSKFFERIKDKDPVKYASVESDKAHSHATDSMARYVGNNLDDFFKESDEKNLINPIFSVPLFRDCDDKGDKKEHNQLVKLATDVREANQALSSKDASRIISYVQRKKNEAPEWLQEVLDYFSGDVEYNSAIVQSYLSYTQSAFFRKVSKEVNGKPKIDKSKLENLIKNSLDLAKTAKDNLDKKKYSDIKEDIWDGYIKPIYIAIAGSLYPKEEAELKKDKDPDREEEIKKLGEMGIYVS